MRAKSERRRATRLLSPDSPDLALAIRKLIDPEPHRCAEADARIGEDVELLRKVVAQLDETPSPAALKKQLKTLAHSLHKSRTLAANLFPGAISKVFTDASPAQGGAHFDTFIRGIDQVAKHAEELADAIIIDHGAQPWKSDKYVAKLLATVTFRDFARDPHARGRKALCDYAASLLFEIVTGHEGEDLSAYEIHDDRKGDRVEPLIRGRMTFGG